VDSYANVTVLFADIVGFTAFSQVVSPEVMVDVLNDLFTRFDHIADHRGLEKIKTIGDCYMAAAGLPIVVHDHADRAAHMALDMLIAIQDFNASSQYPLNIRVQRSQGSLGRANFYMTFGATW
jgi:adenylate cyclase